MAKLSNPTMAGVIVIALLLLFAFSMIVPVLEVSWIKKDAKFDAGLQNTLAVLLTGSIAYFINTTKASQTKDDTIQAQAATLAAAATPPQPNALAAATPTGTPGDPVSTVQAPAQK